MSFPYPWFQLQCKADGSIYLPAEKAALLAAVTAPNGPSDLLILCHGWNNNLTCATQLYTALAAQFQSALDSHPDLAGRTYAISGVFWPSKKFEESDLIPSGAASLNDAVTPEHLKARVRDLSILSAGSEWPSETGARSPDLSELESLMDDIEDNPAAQLRAADLLRGVLPVGHTGSDDGSEHFLTMRNTALVERLSKPLNPPAAVRAGSGAASVGIGGENTRPQSGLGGAAGLRDVLGGIKSGFLNALNYATYYLMKARAGDVGVQTVAPLITELRTKRPELRIHLIGHSFGCRLVSAALNSLPTGEQFRPDTVLLLQGAFSHNGFAQEGDHTDRGAFRDVIEQKKVRGPILITHTWNDKAVGVAYPIASRLSGVNAASLGDATSIFGGLGSNGAQTAQTTPERQEGTLLPVGETYPFASGVPASTPCNLSADAFIMGHSDITKPEVGYALAAGVAARRL